ncbi:MAG: hypothetical protein I8H67_15150 [Comamonadaceae bacterium]|nr:hypothetical protein [Comamonadaceae bacterium]MBH2044291.1 hypothetical protein [Comamonadaceae bacterium]
MSAAVYQHPDGHEITVGDGLLTASTSEGTAVSLPIGPAGLRDVASKLLALSDADTAERAGAELGHELLAELLALHGHPQSEAFRAVRDKLTKLHKLEHFDSAAGGFAAAIVNVLEVGIANLPKFGEVQ